MDRPVLITITQAGHMLGLNRWQMMDLVRENQLEVYQRIKADKGRKREMMLFDYAYIKRKAIEFKKSA